MRAAINPVGGTQGVLLAGIVACVLAMLPGIARAEEPPFGIRSFAVLSASEQAGAHADVTATFMLNTEASGAPADQLKDVQITLPTGLVGNPLATPKCTPTELEVFACQPSAQVGIIKIYFHIGANTEPVDIPVYNLTQQPGHVGTLAASFLFGKILIDVDLSRDGTYDLLATISDISTLLPMTGVSLTLWGVPASPTHNLERSRTELGGPQPIYSQPNEFGEREVIGVEPTPAGVAAAPFLTDATNCSTPSTSTLSVDSWQNPEHYVTQTSTSSAPTGCNLLQVSPTISVVPETTQRDTPTGYDIDLGDPPNEDPYGLATPNLQKVTIALPEGTSLSPGVANGLQECSDEQFAAGACPNASKVGTVAVVTPLLANHLIGTINFGTPSASARYRIFLSASTDNITLRLTGNLYADPSTGQLTVTIDEIPQLPFSELALHLFGGPGAVLANPTGCGPASTTAQFLSYAGQAENSSSFFTVDSNGTGGDCSAAPHFGPHFIAGTISSLAGSFSSFILSVSRDDGEPDLSSITAQLPPGLLAMLSQVPLCGEPQASVGNCSQAAQIGEATMSAGAGTQPLYLSGRVYLTGPYKGSPFGLSIVVPAAAGPVDFGTIIIRAQILVAPTDMHLSIVSDPIPQIIAGIPLRMRTVNLTVTRSGFMVDPTSCKSQAITGTIGSVQGGNFAVSIPFQMVGCSGLRFSPKLTASTRAKASSRGSGASLDIRVLDDPNGTQANISSVLVELPRQLRPRLTTIQQACLAATFLASPTSCPRGSLVGSATIGTPVLSAPMTGSVYLVSHGGSSSPHLMMILESQGIKVTLEGSISISSRGVVSTAFRALPDVPIRAFTLELSRGPHSILGATKDLCSKKLTIPYTITSQSGVQIKRTVKVAVSNCQQKKRTKATAAVPSR